MSIISCPTDEKLADLFIKPLQGNLLKFLAMLCWISTID